ncbi:hypothetical protein Tco_1031227 [Tanacetum coccineum]|uniref:Uncharacterized protein n=1 Tax=Tanacetum coccineum TaxID=301880 RepID=A0ABQ5G8D4_9ASTR
MSKKKQRKDSGTTKPIPGEATNEEHVSTPSYDPSQSGDDRMQLNELMNLCTKLSDRVLALENTNTSQAAEIDTLKERVKKLEKKRRSRTYKPKRLYKVGLSRRIESSNEASLGAQEDASKQGRKIANLDVDADVTLVDETQGRNDEDLMFDTDILYGDEVLIEPVVTTASTTTVATTVDELTLAHTLIEIKAAKPKAITTAATTVTPVPVRPRAKGIAKDKGKAKIDEPEIPLKKKDQIALDDEVAKRLEAEMQAELEEEQRVAKQREEEASLIS